MIQVINEILNNRMLLIVGAIYGVPLTITLIVLFFMKSSRDERGLSIIGKASIISIVVFAVLINAICKFLSHIEISYLTMANCLQWTYDIVLTVEIVAILIYRKIE